MQATKNTLLCRAYELYKIDWCKSRSCEITDMDEETGINGECYVCFAEFEMNEFQDDECMSSLLNTGDYEKWLQLQING